jgi:hypothetical protein
MLFKINREIKINPRIPRTLKKFIHLFVLSNALDGKKIPINEANPTAIPKYPRGTPNI